MCDRYLHLYVTDIIYNNQELMGHKVQNAFCFIFLQQNDTLPF